MKKNNMKERFQQLVKNIKLEPKKQFADINSKVQCTMCGKSCSVTIDRKNKYHVNEFALLSADWGYGSSMDGEMHRCVLCEKCYLKVKMFIERNGGEVLVRDYLRT